MVASPLEAILTELGQTSMIMNLISTVRSWRPNSSNTCLIPFPDGIKVQFELDKEEKNLMIGCVLGNIEPGPYRHRLFGEALRANGMPPPRYGILGYSSKTNNLLLFDFLDLRDLGGNKVSEYLIPFLEKAKIWKEAIEAGNIPSISPQQTAGGAGGRSFFGLKL